MRERSSSSESPPAALCRLAERHGVESAYDDAFGRRRQISTSSLMAVLSSLGVELSDPSRAAERLREEESEPRALDDVVVAWGGRLDDLTVRPHDGFRLGDARLRLEGAVEASGLVSTARRGGDGSSLGFSELLPFGLHELEVAVEGGGGRSSHRHQVQIVSAPQVAERLVERSFGVLAPLYGLQADGQQGDLGTFGRFAHFAARSGASYVATLPFLAEHSGAEASGQAPYSPISRSFFNEGYLDPRRLPGVEAREAVEALSGISGTAERARALWPFLLKGGGLLSGGDPVLSERLRAFSEKRPEVLSYARFRAACQSCGTERRGWPEDWREGRIDEDGLDGSLVSAHLYAQLALDCQLEELSASLGAVGCSLMLDLPIGSQEDGYDTWAHRSAFACGATVGAPPDRFHSAGQDWGFPPLHPDLFSKGGSELWRSALEASCRYAGALRIDHAPGIFRLWWVPAGLEPSMGAYVRYPAEALLGLLCLESSRTKTALVAENLGTVPRSFTTELASHGIAGMRVAVFDLDSPHAPPIEPPTVALVDTHDTATFAGWLSAADAELRNKLGLIDDAELTVLQKRRELSRNKLTERLGNKGILSPGEEDPALVHAALLSELASSEAEVVIVNVEDCLGETDPQNVPGTTGSHANFRRAVRESVPEMELDEVLTRTLSGLARSRPGSATAGER